ncbi:MAG: hypothetical protein LBK64_08445 [Spirochaetaceae bacterium]|nr:hypothetical protein [Spirochaetaceae bacterium]
MGGLVFLLFGGNTLLWAGGGGQSSTPVREIPETIPGPYYIGDGGAGLRLAIMEIEGVEVGDRWLLSLIQGVLISDFRNYTEALAIDSRRNTGDASSLPAGARTIITGKLTATGSYVYILNLSATDVERGIVKATHAATVTAAQLVSLSVIKAASLDLMRQLDIQLTDAGVKALETVDPREREAEIALARGIQADKSGNTIESLSYLYNAVSYDPSLEDALSLLELMAGDLAAGRGGEVLRGDFSNRENWKKILDNFEAFYAEHPPFEVIFVPLVNAKGATDYDTGTVVLQFRATMRESPEFETMNKVLKLILEGLKKSGQQETWGFANWPYRSPLFRKARTYSFSAELVNENDDVLDTTFFDLSGRMVVMRGKVRADSTQNRDFSFRAVDIKQLVGEYVRITTIDDMKIEESQEAGYVKITPAEKMPPKKGRNPFIKLTGDFFDIR